MTDQTNERMYAYLVARSALAGEHYRRYRDEIGLRTLQAIALGARMHYPNARYIGLTTSDQDSSGMQEIVELLDGDGNDLTDDDFLDEGWHDGVSSWDLDDATAGAWQAFCCVNEVTGPRVRGYVECYIDIDAVLTTLEGGTS